jgi:hypothetical protein
MGTFNAVRDASEILKRLLDTALVDVGESCIVHDLVTTSAVGMTLTLMLYEIARDPSARNRPDLRVIVKDTRSRRRWHDDCCADTQVTEDACDLLYSSPCSLWRWY